MCKNIWFIYWRMVEKQICLSHHQYSSLHQLPLKYKFIYCFSLWRNHILRCLTHSHPTIYAHMHAQKKKKRNIFFSLCYCIHCCCWDRKWRLPYHPVITPCWWWSSGYGQRERWKHNDSKNRTLSQPNQYTPVYCIDNQNRKQSSSVCSPHALIAHVNLYFLLQSVMIITAWHACSLRIWK